MALIATLEVSTLLAVDRFYFDHNATTPVSTEVLEVYARVLREEFGNPSSIHRCGQQARQLLETGRRQVAALLGCDSRDLTFLSGGTEANNLALFGVVRASGKLKPHVITTTIEHPAVLNACAQLEREGVAVTYVPVSGSGVVDPADIREALRPETVLISVMHANNEVGTIQPIQEIAAVARDAGALMHCDGVQAAGKIDADVRALGVDLYSTSAHKLYAPKGTGALYVRRGVRLQPVQFGGRQEQGRRAGTENVPGAAAFGAAAAWARANLRPEAVRVGRLRDRFEELVTARVDDVTFHGKNAPRLPNTSSVCVEGIEGEALVIALDLRGFAVSSGSACSSGAVEPSHVLMAMGLSKERARSSIRISLGRMNTEEQIERLAAALAQATVHLRKLSPAYA